ncbi:Gmad2 immunoglobulin-like domain-containing protein [Paenibacillus aurantius]|uniref:Gmad2 immunoglobulin-like domain-containing protein n=1 Tax=Paenibacillus aurantius TaxID=2918900 RepID=A0AA96REW9_9BACL|nr:Gmad2 immunoglobulin-like domain-containing protein [Paenibacillus aurantius]WNQ10856.1 Gmad2 immunoglobulin-like domain-containing protein [Paenibacillus aurantius]
MRRHRKILFPALLSLILLSACGQKPASSGPSAPPDSGPPSTGTSPSPSPSASPSASPSPTPVKEIQAIDKGTLLKKEGSRWLITEYRSGKDSPSVEAIWFTVTDKTALQDSKGKSLTADKLPVGSRVSAWTGGAIAESYPGQAGAARIVLQEETGQGSEGRISRSEAVQAALKAQAAGSAISAVKSASLDEAKGVWTVELVTHDAPAKPAAVRIDAATGKPVRTPVAENEAFRVFSPAPGSTPASTFTVEGEARVFEAVFHWTLEDGHNVLAEGNVTADGGAPAWGPFHFDVTYKQASQENMMLVLYWESAKDGKPANQLVIPLKAAEGRIRHIGE